MNKLEKDSVKDDKESQKISARTILTVVLLVGIGLMIFAYLSGYFTAGGPEGERRMGPVSPEDSAMVTPSDTVIGK